jgi:hypothetical protein
MESSGAAQLAVIGAMQRSHPALTQLWLRWTGIPDLEHAEFGLSRPEEGGAPDTRVTFTPKAGVQSGWQAFCDAMGLEPDAVERRSMPIHLKAKSKAHLLFWQAMLQREMNDVDGPLEWWWRLLVLRNRGIKRASKKLATAVFGEDAIFNDCVLSLENRSLSKEGRRVENILVTGYKRPTRLLITRSVSLKAQREGLAFSLDDDKLRALLTTRLISLATTKMS